MSNVLVTGANGQLGSELKLLIGMAPDCNFLFTATEQLDITNHHQLTQIFEKHQFDYCINAAAYTAVDKAESEPDRAELVNATALNYIARQCKDHNTVLIHASTDFVFDGTKSVAYTENDATHPLNIYGSTKLIGEKEALAHNPHTIIIRTSWLYSIYGNNFVKTMLRLAKERSHLNIVSDQIGTPTYARDLAKVIMNIILRIQTQRHEGKPDENLWGIYHYSDEGVASWYDFAQAIFEMTDTLIELHPIKSHQYPTPAKRPHFSLMDKTKIKETFGLKIPHWRKSLHKCIHELQIIEENNT